MARKTSRRGGAWYDGIRSALGFKTKEEKCAAKKADYDKECGPGEASAVDTPSTSTASAEMSGAPASMGPAPGQTAGRSRRRRVTRRKTYKGGKHRRSHY